MSSDSVVSMAESVPLLVERLTKRFGSLLANDAIDLRIAPGECFGLLGPNGAGKTTLIRSIVGRVIPDSGRVLILGTPASSPQARAALGWVPQELALYPRLSCRENLEAFGRYHGLDAVRLREAVEWCLGWSALSDRAAEPVNRLSGGMKRRLNMAAGLIHRPKIVLMDEPTVGVDPQSRLRIFEMIEGLRSQGMSVIYTTHYMEEAERLCDRIAIVDHGRVIAQGTKDELVRNAFGSRSEVRARFSESEDRVGRWVTQHHGSVVEGMAQFTIENPTEIAGLLESAAREGLGLVDISLHRPDLESVFLKLTGRELRD